MPRSADICTTRRSWGRMTTHMTPNTFFGYTLTGKFGNAETGGRPSTMAGGWISAIKHRGTPSTFSRWQAKPVPTSIPVWACWGGLMTGGPPRSAPSVLLARHTQHLLCRGEVRRELRLTANAIGAAQFVDQRTTGQNLLTGGNFATNQFGAKIDLGYQTESRSATPWSIRPSPYRRRGAPTRFTPTGEIQAFNRAGRAGVHGRLVLYLHTHRLARRGGVGVLFQRVDQRPRRGRAAGRRRSGTSISSGGRAGSRCRDFGCARFCRTNSIWQNSYAHQHRRGAPDRELRHQALLIVQGGGSRPWASQ